MGPLWYVYYVQDLLIFFHFFHSLENLSIHSITHVCVNISDGVIFFSATDIDDLNEQLRGDRQQIQQVIEMIYVL